MERLQSMNYWNKYEDKKIPHSAQAVLRPETIVAVRATAGSCGSGSCNCGGGCNGECGGE